MQTDLLGCLVSFDVYVHDDNMVKTVLHGTIRGVYLRDTIDVYFLIEKDGVFYEVCSSSCSLEK